MKIHYSLREFSCDTQGLLKPMDLCFLLFLSEGETDEIQMVKSQSAARWKECLDTFGQKWRWVCLLKGDAGKSGCKSAFVQ